MQKPAPPLELRGISSKATQAILGDLTALYLAQTGVHVHIESVGGVDAARRVQAGEAFDVVLLASDAIDRLITTGHLQTGSRCDWVHSPIAMAVPSGKPHPQIHDEASLKAAVMAAPSLSYSTGPSGVYLEQLFARWGIVNDIQARVVVPPPGTPVGALIASGQVALGFQQLSELLTVKGLDVLGNLPKDVAYITTFSAGLPASLTQAPERLQAAQAFLQFLASAQVEPAKQKQGMSWAS